ncbi:hypothetical protein NC652_026572 [Populus alba x Populus x berolinensis]|nr:hypothetical protein NC652_026572 [Populus alba x Populus x berolinensis]
MATAFFLCGDALPVFLQERNIFMRETAHNTYRRSSGLPGFLFYFLMNSAAFWAGRSVVTFISGFKSFFIFHDLCCVLIDI